MNWASSFAILAISGCGIDDRSVELNRSCVDPAAGGTIVDFSQITSRFCPAAFCAEDLFGSGAVSLGEGTLGGLVFPYAAPGLQPVSLGTIALPPAGETPPRNAIWAALDSTPAPGDAPSAPSGFALRFADCVDASAYSALTFDVDVTNGSLGNCPLRFGLQFIPSGSTTFGDTLPLDAYEQSAVVFVTQGTNTLAFASPGRSASTALAGMQWEFSVPSGGPAGCSAYFTLDGIRLAAAP